MRKDRVRIIEGLATVVLVFFSFTAIADELTEKARALLGEGKSSKAYQLLEPAEAVRAGDSDYDFLLGLAALDVGQNTRAVFALERVLAMDPNNVRARAEIARAYLALGETETATHEFATVKKQGVPADVAMTIDRYLDAVRRIEDKNQTSLTGYLETTAGYDTNVNAGPNRTTVAIPGFGSQPFRLTKDSQANQSSFGAISGGFNLRTPIGAGYMLLAGASAYQKSNFHRHQFDTLNGDVNVGVSKSADQDVYTLMAQAGSVSVDESQFRKHAGLTGQWLRNLDARNQIGAFAQYTDLQYQSSKQSIRDANRWVAGASYAHLYREGIMVFASAYGVQEQPQKDNVGWLGFDGVGIRLGGRMNLSADTVLFGGATWEHRGYDKADPSFLETRRDNQYGLLLGATRYFSKEWSVTPQVAFTKNSSNINLFEYRREMFSVSVRREF